MEWAVYLLALTRQQTWFLLSAGPTYPTRISMDSYFGACPGGRFRDPSLPPTEESLALLMRVLQAEDEQAKHLNTCCYFQFSGSDEAVWDPTFNARMAWEGFFTITTQSSRHGKKSSGSKVMAAVREPLPELQPFYGILTWPNFHAAKHVRAQLARLRRQNPHKQECRQLVGSVGGGTGGGGGGQRRQRMLRVIDSAQRRDCWEHLEAYHNGEERSGENWLSEQYFEMMVAASDNPAINFRMHTILLVDENEEEATTTALAGEIGFSVGRVYTSLSGWTATRTAEAHGTTQLVLLGLWLQARGYAFWSLGHCYSPVSEYGLFPYNR